MLGLIYYQKSPYTLKEDLNIDGQVISSGEMVCEENYFLPISINYHCCVSSKNKP